MKFLEINNIIKTNVLFSKLKAFNPNINLEIEAYSCKQTKEQKKYYKIPKPLRFYISVLELAFPDYDFSNETLSSFKKTSMDIVIKEMSYLFFVLYKNNDEVTELLSYLEALLGQCLNLRKTSVLLLDRTRFSESDYRNVFLLHDKKLKRIIVLKYGSDR